VEMNAKSSDVPSLLLPSFLFVSPAFPCFIHSQIQLANLGGASRLKFFWFTFNANNAQSKTADFAPTTSLSCSVFEM